MISRSIAGLVTAAVTVAAASSNSNDFDVVDDFCLRAYHQSTVKNGTLYIDGGLEVFQHGNDTDTRTLGYNTKLIEVDMSSSWDWKTNISIKAVDKTANPATGSDPPLVIRGALFAGAETEPDIYLYGGTVSYANTSFPGWNPPSSSVYSLWSYATSNRGWGQYDVSRNVSLIPAGGAYAEAPDLGLAFYLNGFIDNGTANQFGDWPDFYSYLDGLVVLDTNAQTAVNLSTNSLRQSPRMGGNMAYIEGAGPQGVLVALGGLTKPVGDNTRANNGTYVTFDEIDFFDVSSVGDGTGNGTWYTQKASGDIPDPRTDFCLTVASAKDGSSHNIYMYGGKGNGTHFDNVYVLSLPSFTWTFLFKGESPRWGHTCHLVAGHQMLTVGGQLDLTDNILGTCDWEVKGVAILDMSTLEWGSVYNASYEDYEVPPVVYNVIGGHENGNATMVTPVAGWANPRSALFFDKGEPMVQVTGGNGNEALGQSSGSRGLSAGGIAGAVVGSVAGAALVIALAFFWVRRRRGQSSPEPEVAGRDEDKKQDPADPERRVELPGGTVQIAQLPDEEAPVVFEMDGTTGRRELHGHSINEVGSPMSPTTK